MNSKNLNFNTVHINIIEHVKTRPMIAILSQLQERFVNLSLALAFSHLSSADIVETTVLPLGCELARGEGIYSRVRIIHLAKFA
jgi:hypothetical protein